MPKKLGTFHVLLFASLQSNFFFNIITLFDLKCAVIKYYYVFVLFECPDVYIDVPDIIDISHMRSKGIQPGEELLPEAGMSSGLYSQIPN